MKAYKVIEEGLVIIISDGEWVTYPDEVLFIDYVGDIMLTTNTYRYQKRPCYRLINMYYDQVSLNSDASVNNDWLCKDINIVDIEFKWKGKRYRFNEIPNGLINEDISWERNRKLEEIGI